MLKVQVVVTTYNHAKYLPNALDSILAQQTEHAFQILIHDDASTDGTREIVEDYAARHPGKFECILQDENQFQQNRRIAVLVWPHYRAEYIAYLDGDDSWTDPTKLQSQIDFLDQNPNCAICQTQAVFFDNKTGETIEHFPPETRRKTRQFFEDLAPANFLLTSAVMHRRSALPELPSDFGEIGFGDYAKFALVARAGWIGLIPKDMVKYRVHNNNMWFGKPYEDRLKKTQIVQGYVARHAAPPFDALWRAHSTGSPIPGRLIRTCRRARLRLNMQDALIGHAKKLFGSNK